MHQKFIQEALLQCMMQPPPLSPFFIFIFFLASTLGSFFGFGGGGGGDFSWFQLRVDNLINSTYFLQNQEVVMNHFCSLAIIITPALAICYIRLFNVV